MSVSMALGYDGGSAKFDLATVEPDNVLHVETWKWENGGSEHEFSEIRLRCAPNTHS
jgi:hypothetical protein